MGKQTKRRNDFAPAIFSALVVISAAYFRSILKSDQSNIGESVIILIILPICIGLIFSVLYYIFIRYLEPFMLKKAFKKLDDPNHPFDPKILMGKDQRTDNYISSKFHEQVVNRLTEASHLTKQGGTHLNDLIEKEKLRKAFDLVESAIKTLGSDILSEDFIVKIVNPKFHEVKLSRLRGLIDLADGILDELSKNPNSDYNDQDNEWRSLKDRIISNRRFLSKYEKAFYEGRLTL